MIRVNGAAKQAAVSTPAAPTNLSFVSCDGLYPRWTAPSGTLTGYDLHYTSANAATVANDARPRAATHQRPGWRLAVHCRSTNCVLQHLTNGMAYRVRLRAKNSAAPAPGRSGRGRRTSLSNGQTPLFKCRG